MTTSMVFGSFMEGNHLVGLMVGPIRVLHIFPSKAGVILCKGVAFLCKDLFHVFWSIHGGDLPHSFQGWPPKGAS